MACGMRTARPGARMADRDVPTPESFLRFLFRKTSVRDDRKRPVHTECRTVVFNLHQTPRHNMPRCAIDVAMPAPTIRWSSTRTSIVRNTRRSSSVISLSA